MTLFKEGNVKPYEVVAMAAFMPDKNEVIKDGDIMDQQSLPKVKMPNVNGFSDAPPWKHGQKRLAGYQ